MRKKLFTVVAFTILVTLIVSGQIQAESNEGIEIGNMAPDFELETIDGEKVNLSELRGKKVMLNFWATWCPPCRVEMPDMQRLHENNDAIVLAVNLTDTEMGADSVNKFLNEYGLTFQVVMDRNGEVSNLYRINPIPTTFMIDTKGVIRHKQFGAMTYDEMVSQLNKME